VWERESRIDHRECKTAYDTFYLQTIKTNWSTRCKFLFGCGDATILKIFIDCKSCIRGFQSATKCLNECSIYKCKNTQQIKTCNWKNTIQEETFWQRELTKRQRRREREKLVF